VDGTAVGAEGGTRVLCQGFSRIPNKAERQTRKDQPEKITRKVQPGRDRRGLRSFFLASFLVGSILEQAKAENANLQSIGREFSWQILFVRAFGVGPRVHFLLIRENYSE
jgi:hypothetical protein